MQLEIMNCVIVSLLFVMKTASTYYCTFGVSHFC